MFRFLLITVFIPAFFVVGSSLQLQLYHVVPGSIFIEKSQAESWPVTVDEAVNRLRIDLLSHEEIEKIRFYPKDYFDPYMNFSSTSIMNEFGLYDGNRDLLESCDTLNPVTCLKVIFAALWEQLRAELSAAEVQKLDCHYEMLERIKINTNGWYLFRMGEMLQEFQRQIDKDGLSLSQPCGEIPKIDIEGDPDMQCWIRFEFESESSLRELLGWISWRNAFTVTHRPPKIIFSYNDPCAWPERNTYFEPQSAGDS